MYLFCLVFCVSPIPCTSIASSIKKSEKNLKNVLEKLGEGIFEGILFINEIQLFIFQI